MIGNVYHCNPQVSSTQDRTLTEVRGNHLSGRTNSDVEYLLIYNQNLNYVPDHIQAFFPNLRGVEWFNSNLLEVSASDLRQFPNILIFSAFVNKLITIESDLFEFTPHLQWISFYNNLIQHVGYDLLSNLTDLQTISFETNPCINEYAVGSPAIMELNQRLPLLCPPIEATSATPQTTTSTSTSTTTTTSTSTTTFLPTTTSISATTTSEEPDGYCAIGCVDRIETSESQILLLQSQVALQNEVIAQLERANENYESRIVELEMQMREINSGPCSPCSK